MRRTLAQILVVVGALSLVLLALAAVVGVLAVRRGFSARTAPSRLEEFVALRVRALATPAATRARKNPLPASEDVIAGARHHWADHCAQCHSNDGSGQTEMGQNLYPKAPDMRAARTQNLTDGELYSIIQNGIRLSGMPAWGDEHENDDETWALVAFIRHLPSLAPAELQEMEKFNPRPPAEQAEDQEEQDFLRGGDAKGAGESKGGHQHHP